MRSLKPYIVGVLGGMLGIALLPLSGLLPISAAPGQPAVLDWYFNMAAQQAITLRSLGVTVPSLDMPGMAERGAGHYDMVCADCHGSPAQPPRQLARDLSPSPPLLGERMEQWHPRARVFWTVKHGIRHTAMPGWPSQMRDDEVWDMVVFLEQLPSMNAQAYRDLTLAGEGENCARCHGENGEGRLAGVPRLDLQSPAYLAAALKGFRDGTRQSGTMMAATRQLSDAEIVELAGRYGRSVAVEVAGQGTAATIAGFGLPNRNIPACDSCHGPAARADYPRLAEQDADYLRSQLELFKTLGAARGGHNAHIMAEVVRGLTPAEMDALANWYGR